MEGRSLGERGSRVVSWWAGAPGGAEPSEGAGRVLLCHSVSSGGTGLKGRSPQGA